MHFRRRNINSQLLFLIDITNCRLSIWKKFWNNKLFYSKQWRWKWSVLIFNCSKDNSASFTLCRTTFSSNRCTTSPDLIDWTLLLKIARKPSLKYSSDNKKDANWFNVKNNWHQPGEWLYYYNYSWFEVFSSATISCWHSAISTQMKECHTRRNINTLEFLRLLAHSKNAAP